jgi:hypothetical protein
MRPWFSLILITIALVSLPGATSKAESIGVQKPEGRSSRPLRGPTGLITDRLNRKQLEIWRAMERIACAKDGTGQPLYPLLYEAHTWAQTSGFSIYIEMPRPTSVSPYKAAECVPEESRATPSAAGRLVIRLYLSVIDQAQVERTGFPSGEFVPFFGLTGEARYCETLVHELTHARQWLTDSAYADLIDEQERLNGQFLQLLHKKRQDDATRQKKSEIQRLLCGLGERIEASAIAAEMEVWRELSSTRPLQLASNAR